MLDQIRRTHGRQWELATRYLTTSKGKSNLQARSIARELLGVDVYWNWDLSRTCESFYRYQGGTKCAVRAIPVLSISRTKSITLVLMSPLLLYTTIGAITEINILLIFAPPAGISDWVLDGLYTLLEAVICLEC